MKKLLLTLLGICCGASLFAAAGSTTPQGWYDDFAAAEKEAKKTGRPILLLLTGSDWCPYCVKLKQNALDKKDFKSFAKKRLILVYADFPRRTELPEELRCRKSCAAGTMGSPGSSECAVSRPRSSSPRTARSWDASADTLPTT